MVEKICGKGEFSAFEPTLHDDYCYFNRPIQRLQLPASGTTQSKIMNKIMNNYLP